MKPSSPSPKLAPRLIVVKDAGIEAEESSYELEDDLYAIGRHTSCYVVIQHQEGLISRLHARIERVGPRYILADAGSTNGTFVNGVRISEPHVLKDNDWIGLGLPDPHLRFRDPDMTRPAQALASAATPAPSPWLRYDEKAMIFFLENQPLDLSPNQLRLLRHLYTHAGELCTHESCGEVIWGHGRYDKQADVGALHEAIFELRRKLRPLDKLLTSRRGVGYLLYLDAPPPRADESSDAE